MQKPIQQSAAQISAQAIKWLATLAQQHAHSQIISIVKATVVHYVGYFLKLSVQIVPIFFTTIYKEFACHVNKNLDNLALNVIQQIVYLAILGWS